MKIAVANIQVPTSRQRKHLGDLESLKMSLQKIGQIVPIVVEADPAGFADSYWLVAGERRLSSARELKWIEIEAIEFHSLSEEKRTLIELEENIRRKQLDWAEEVLAISKYVSLVKEPLALTGATLSMSSSNLSKMLTLAEGLVSIPKLALASSWTAAYEQYKIQLQRKSDANLEYSLAEEEDFEAAEAIDIPLPFELPAGLPKSSPTILPPNSLTFSIEKEDFSSWVTAYTGKRFNLIHCDFPYGLNMDKAKLQNSSFRWDFSDPRYADSPELFDTLCKTFFSNQDSFIADSAHCIFWLSPRNYGRIASRFTYFGWTVCETPLIWHKSDNAGIAPDVYRWPRRTYEMALFASRGDRKILKVKAASYSGPTTKEYHLSEKPKAMLEHFFEMLVDGNTSILDPTCGSGNALAVAKNFGASSGLGLDIIEDHISYARSNVNG